MTLRLLWGSPLPPIRSGVADYAVELLPELARRAEVRVLIPPGQEPAREGPLAAIRGQRASLSFRHAAAR